MYDAHTANADSAKYRAGGSNTLKIFWRLILPLVLAVVLAAGPTLAGLMGRRVWWRSWWLQRDHLYLGAGIFVVLFVTSLWRTLTWGKESEEYAELLKEEDEEAKRRRQDDSF